MRVASFLPRGTLGDVLTTFVLLPSIQTLPIFRTESQDRMLASSTNYAFGFFGWPLDGKFLQEVTIEQAGVSLCLGRHLSTY